MKFTIGEIAVVKDVRADNPAMRQRALARMIETYHQGAFNTPRSFASIYSVLRRVDKAAKEAAAKATEPTTTRRSRRAQFSGV